MASLLLSGATKYAEETTIPVTVELRYRSTSELVPPLHQLLGNRGTVTAFGEQLTIHASPDLMAQARYLITELDVPPRMLLFSIIQTDDIFEARELLATDARSESGAGRSTTIGRSRRPRYNGAEAQVRIMEGHVAFVRLGRTVPGIQLLWVDVMRGGAVPNVGLVSRESGSGFYLRARVTGRKVTLQLYHYADNPTLNQTTGYTREDIGTTVTGYLGQWMDLGGSLDLAVESYSQSGYALQRPYEDKTRVLARVLLGPP
jgi:hypothetical protein